MSAALWARAGWLIAVVLSLVAVPTADAAPLRLDGRFGEGGIAHVRFRLEYTSEDLRVLRPVRQPDGKVLVAASASLFHGNSEIVLPRFTRSGRPDATFGHGGWERLGYRWNFDPMAVQVQPDGRILVLGAAGYGPFFYPAPGQFGLVRLLPDGSRDRTFGTNGLVTWNPPWRADTQSMTALPGLFVPQGDGRVLAAGMVDEARWLGDPYTSPAVTVQRVAFVRFNENGSVDESFGRAGVIEELDLSDSFFQSWAALPDGRIVALASRNEGSGASTWWLHRFKADGTLDRGFGQDGSLRLESDYVGELVPARDGSLVILGGTALRRILPSGQLDARFGTACGRPGPRASSSGGAVSSDGGVLVTATRFLIHARPRRIDSFVFRYGSDGCVLGRPLRIRAVAAGPPLLQRRRTALVGATYNHADPADGGVHDTLALIRIHR
jgi:uncharacterized delta-60 repeat protein